MGVDSKQTEEQQQPSSAAVPAVAPGVLKKQSSQGNISEEIEDSLSTLPNMKIAEIYFTLQHQHSAGSTLPATETSYKDELLALIKANQMTPFYKRVCEEFQWSIDQDLVAAMSAENHDEAKQLDAQLEDATENLGDIEVLEALLTKARMFSRIGDEKAALEAFKVAGEKPQSINQKILVALHIIRIGLFFSDLDLVETHIKKAAVYVHIYLILESVGMCDPDDSLMCAAECIG